MGGEKGRGPWLGAPQPGSPPRGRGKGIYRVGQRKKVRITPAWAGKSSYPATRSSWSWDHPRIGGEKLGRMAVAISVIGSLPHRREKVRRGSGLQEQEGITPAQAGKSCGFAACSCTCRDHPRVGGEKSSLSSASLHGPGSPPRGRGKGQIRPRRGLQRGITPAQAGKSWEEWRLRFR